MPNTGPQFAGTGSGAGWAGANLITGTSGFAICTVPIGGISPLLTGTNFPFGINNLIPTGATITGVVVTATTIADSDFELEFNSIQLVSGGVAIGTPKSDTAKWQTSAQTFSYGNPTDLWGAVLTPAIVNSSTFGFRTNVHNVSSSESDIAAVQAYTITIYYSGGGGSGGGAGGVSNGGTTTPLNLLLIPVTGPQFAGLIYTLDPTNSNDPNSGSFYNWKVEDMIAGRTGTISRVIISYRDLGVASLFINLSGTNDAGQAVNAGEFITIGNTVPLGIILTQVVGLALTAQNLQFSVVRPANAGPVSITKIRLEGRLETTPYA